MKHHPPPDPSDAVHFAGLVRVYASANTNQPYRNLTLEVSAGRAVVSYEATAALHHAAGGVHGAHVFKLLDDAAFFAVNSMVADVFVLTAQFSVQLFRPATTGVLRAEGRVTKPGRQTFFAESVLVGPDGKELARGHGSFSRSRFLLADVPGYARPAAP